MIFEVLWVESKSADWKVASLKEKVENGRTFENVSINRTGKQGEVFPNFDGIMAGAEVHGDFWSKPDGSKNYLFAPKAPAASKPWAKGGASGVKAAQERKAEHIAEAQENKAHGIKVAAAMRDATLLAIAALEGSSFETVEEREAELASAHARIKTWYLRVWGETEKSLDVPF